MVPKPGSCLEVLIAEILAFLQFDEAQQAPFT